MLPQFPGELQLQMRSQHEMARLPEKRIIETPHALGANAACKTLPVALAPAGCLLRATTPSRQRL